MLKEESLNDRIGRLDYILLIKSFCQKLIAFLAKPPAPPPTHTHTKFSLERLSSRQMWFIRFEELSQL